MISNTKARLLLRQRVELGEDQVAEFVVWEVPASVRGSAHRYKYRLAYIENELCVIRYDNEAGKGDHKHIGGAQVDYRFSDLETLLRDFEVDIENWRNRP